MPDLIDELQKSPTGFDLFQALHLLERAHRHRRRIGTGLGHDEAVRLKSKVSLAFEPSDVTTVANATDTHEPPVLETAVMGLAGAQGPLPLVFTELLLERARRRDRAGLDFLDILNQRLLGFLYRSRAKHRLALHSGDLQTAPTLRLIDALSAVGLNALPSGEAPIPAALHAALQGPAPRSVATLERLVALSMGLRVQARSFVGRWVGIGLPDRAVLGRRAGLLSRLGINSALGDRAWDQGAGIELRTEPLTALQLDDLLPGNVGHRRLNRLVHDYFQLAVEVRLNAPLRANQAQAAVLSATTGARLGLSTWLGRGHPCAQSATTVGPGLVRAAGPTFTLRS